MCRCKEMEIWLSARSQEAFFETPAGLFDSAIELFDVELGLFERLEPVELCCRH